MRSKIYEFEARQLKLWELMRFAKESENEKKQTIKNSNLRSGV
jgi:hypothetical protein